MDTEIRGKIFWEGEHEIIRPFCLSGKVKDILVSRENIIMLVGENKLITTVGR